MKISLGEPIGVMTGRHALLYEDGNVALTLYEARYLLFDLRNGKCLNDSGLKMTNQGLIDIRNGSIPSESTRNNT